METTTSEATTQMPVRPAVMALTDKAAAKVAEFLAAEDNPEFFLRVAVQPGGCSGLRYALYFDDRKLEGDEETLYGDVAIRVDRMSAPYLRGATLDWLETLEQSGFQIQNPNAGGTCACGDSFH